MNADRLDHRTTLCRLAAWALLIATTAVVVFARIRLLGIPLERDEGEYAYTGQLILHGIAPYKLAYSMKFPGTAAAYAVLMSIFGESTIGIRAGLLVANVATAGCIFALGRILVGEIAGATAAAAYSVTSLMPYVLGTAAHATHFVALFAVAGSLLLIRASKRNSTPLICTSGCLFGLALLMKQSGLFFALFGAAYLLGSDWRAQLKAREIMRRTLLFILGAGLPLTIACLLLWKAGAFERFWFWTIRYAGQYGSQVSLSAGARILADHLSAVVGTAWPIWAIAAIGLVVSALTPIARINRVFLIMFTVFSALAVCPGFYFRPHYFILFLPAVSLLAGATIQAVLQWTKSLCPVVLLLFALCLAWPIWSEADFFFERPLPEANRMINGTNPFPESVKIGEYIREHSSPSETIAVLGSEPQIYFYSQRNSATGYIYTYGLMEPQPYAHQMQEEMMREVEAARPKFLVLVVVNKSWLAGRDSDQTILRWADSYCDANYEEVGLINISDAGTDYYFSGRPPNITPTAEHILIYRRRS